MHKGELVVIHSYFVKAIATAALTLAFSGIASARQDSVRCDQCRPAQANDAPTISAAVGAAQYLNAHPGDSIAIIRVVHNPGGDMTTARFYSVLSTPVYTQAQLSDEGFERNADQVKIPPVQTGGGGGWGTMSLEPWGTVTVGPIGTP
jgi:hypothetical protein